MVVVANPLTSETIMRLAVLMRHRRNRSPLTALFVRTNDDPTTINMGRNALTAAAALATASDVEVKEVERFDLNVVRGIISVAHENRISDIILGMHRKSNLVDTFYGTLIEQLLRSSNRMVFLSRCFIPVDTLNRLVVVAGEKVEYETGFQAWVERMGNLASQLACRVVFLCNKSTSRFIRNILVNDQYAIRYEFVEIASFDDFIVESASIDADDLLVVVNARRGSISWSSFLEAMPSYLQKNFSSQNLLIIYPEQFNNQ